jgi:hypothetical protein
MLIWSTAFKPMAGEQIMTGVCFRGNPNLRKERENKQRLIVHIPLPGHSLSNITSSHLSKTAPSPNRTRGWGEPSLYHMGIWGILMQTIAPPYTDTPSAYLLLCFTPASLVCRAEAQPTSPLHPLLCLFHIAACQGASTPSTTTREGESCCGCW